MRKSHYGVHTTQEYIIRIVGGDKFDVLKYSKGRIVQLTYDFIVEKINGR
jgi:hypothetical protein